MTLPDWLREHPPPPSSFRQTLAGVARRAVEGVPFLLAVREFLDEYTLRPSDLRFGAIADPPEQTGEGRYDAFLAALAEHLALSAGLVVPSWTSGRERFLDRFWFVSEVKGFRAVSIARAPAAFRRRGVFLHPDALVRY